MSVTLRGSRFHYRFQFEGKSYSGVCEGCDVRSLDPGRAKKIAEADRKDEDKKAIEKWEKFVRNFNRPMKEGLSSWHIWPGTDALSSNLGLQPRT